MLVMLFGNVIEVSPVQFRNAESLMLVPLVMTTCCRLALGITAIAFSGKITETSSEQPEKASTPMLVTLSGMVMEVSPK